jgi:hypothetical protein
VPDNWRSMYRRAASRSCQFLLNRQRSTYSSSTRARSLASWASAADSASGDARSPGHPGGGRPACSVIVLICFCPHGQRSCLPKNTECSSSVRLISLEDADMSPVYKTQRITGLAKQEAYESKALPHLRRQRPRQTAHRPGCHGRCAGQARAPLAWRGRRRRRVQPPGARHTPETACWKASGLTRYLGPLP